jgi:glycosyltransferase involved in cell wall biosynthesis
MNVTLKKLLSNSALRQQYGAQARKTVCEKFNLKRTSDQFMPIFLDAIKQARIGFLFSAVLYL